MKTPAQQVAQAIRDGDCDTLRDLLSSSPELASQGSQCWPHWAARRGNPQVLQILIDFGFSIDSSGLFGETPLCSAASAGSIETVRWLIANGASLNIEDKDKNPLLHAIESKQSEVAQFLIDAGIDPFYEYPDGTNALSHAQCSGAMECIELLGGSPLVHEPWVQAALPDFSGQPMSRERIDAIEETLGVRFPSHLSDFLLRDFPPELFFEDAPDNDDWEWLGPDHAMFHTVRSYVAYNTTDSRAFPLTRLFDEYLVIGTNGGGDYWCVSTDGTDLNVYFYNHETHEITDTGHSLAEHTQSLMDSGFAKDDELTH